MPNHPLFPRYDNVREVGAGARTLCDQLCCMNATGIGLAEYEPGLVLPQHLEWIDATKSQTDTGVWNLDLPNGEGRDLMCNHHAIVHLGMCNKPKVGNLQKRGHGCWSIALIARPIAYPIRNCSGTPVLLA